MIDKKVIVNTVIGTVISALILAGSGFFIKTIWDNSYNLDETVKGLIAESKIQDTAQVDLLDETVNRLEARIITLESKMLEMSDKGELKEEIKELRQFPTPDLSKINSKQINFKEELQQKVEFLRAEQKR